MRPMSLAESGESNEAVSLGSLFEGEGQATLGGPSVEEYAHLVVRGGWPELVNTPEANPADYLQSYVDDISRTDLQAADMRVDPLRMEALIRSLARNVATEVSVPKLAAEADLPSTGDVSVSLRSARTYLDALQSIFVLEEQPAWSTHLRSKVRLRVHPKWHFIDPSLAAAALQASPGALLEDLNTFGFLFESMAIRDLRIYADVHRGRTSHYRDSSHLEIDAVVELRDGRWAAFEVKIGGQKHIDAAAENLLRLRAKVSAQRAEQLQALVVLTAGDMTYLRDDGIQVLSLGHLTA